MKKYINKIILVLIIVLAVNFSFLIYVLYGSGGFDKLLYTYRFNKVYSHLIGTWGRVDDEENMLVLTDDGSVLIGDMDLWRFGKGRWELDCNQKLLNIDIKDFYGIKLMEPIVVSWEYTIEKNKLVLKNRQDEIAYKKQDNGVEPESFYQSSIIMKIMPSAGSDTWLNPSIESSDISQETLDIIDKEQNHKISGQRAIDIIENYYSDYHNDKDRVYYYSGISVMNNSVYHSIRSYGDEMLHSPRSEFVDIETGAIYEYNYETYELDRVGFKDTKQSLSQSEVVDFHAINIDNQMLRKIINDYNKYCSSYSPENIESITLSLDTFYCDNKKYNLYEIWTYNGERSKESLYSILTDTSKKMYVYNRETNEVILLKDIRKYEDILVSDTNAAYRVVGYKDIDSKEYMVFAEGYDESNTTYYYVDITTNEIKK